LTITKFKIKQFRNIKVKKIDSELGQKVQASGSKLEKIDDAVVDWHLPSLFKPQRLPDQLCGGGKMNFLTCLKFFPTPFLIGRIIYVIML